jgi:uncharacterized protein
MHVGLLRVTLHIPAAHSLKDRRAVVRRAVERTRARFNVSVAEVGDSNHWQRAQIAVTAVSGVDHRQRRRRDGDAARARAALVLR